MKKQLRILHVISSVESTNGGPPVIVSRLASAQSRLGCACTLYSHEPRAGVRTVIDELPSIPGGSSVTTVYCSAERGAVSSLLRSATYRVSRSLVADFDVVHLNGLWDPMLWRVAYECRTLSVPYVVTIHGMLHPWSLRQSRLKKRVALTYLRGAYLGSASFLHLGNSEEARLIAPLRLAVPTEIIPNGVFVEEFFDPPPVEKFHELFPQLNGRPYLLFLGRLHIKKGLDILVDSFNQVQRLFPQLQLVIAGPDDGYGPILSELIASRGLAKKTHLIGSIYGQVKLAAFSGARAFCLPSRQEGFSIAITESLATGTPTVVTHSACYPEVETCGAGFCSDSNAEAFAQAIIKTLNEPRAALSEKGKRLIAQRFNWPIVAAGSLLAYGRHCFV